MAGSLELSCDLRPGEARQMHSNKPKSASFMTTEFVHELDFRRVS